MNGYVCFYKGKRLEIVAHTLLEAKQSAIRQLKVPKKMEGMVAVMLAEKDGEPIKHVADF